jgi:hypothetical protein
MPIRHGGKLASRASTSPRDHFCRSTIVPCRSRPPTWNEFLPISMPIVATIGIFVGHGGPPFNRAPSQHASLEGQEHGRTSAARLIRLTIDRACHVVVYTLQNATGVTLPVQLSVSLWRSADGSRLTGNVTVSPTCGSSPCVNNYVFPAEQMPGHFKFWERHVPSIRTVGSAALFLLGMSSASAQPTQKLPACTQAMIVGTVLGHALDD